MGGFRWCLHCATDMPFDRQELEVYEKTAKTTNRIWAYFVDYAYQDEGALRQTSAVHLFCQEGVTALYVIGI